MVHAMKTLEIYGNRHGLGPAESKQYMENKYLGFQVSKTQNPLNPRNVQEPLMHAYAYHGPGT